MNAAPAATARITAETTRDGKLLRADPVLIGLQLQAGGAPHGPLAIPQLAGLVRLAARMNVALSRPALIASEDVDVDIWVRVKPDGEQVRIAITDWRERPARRFGASAGADAVAVFAAPGWEWQADTQLRLLVADDRQSPAGHAMPEPGMLLTDYFRLVETEAPPRLPMLAAMAERQPFLDQPAVLRADEGVRYRLAGVPLTDGLGRLIGFRGKAGREPDPVADERGDEPGAPVPAGPFGLDFGRRLDHALRQPLGRIIANADTISGQLEGPLRQDYADYAADIAVAGRHLMELVDDLADLQAIERPGFVTAREEVDLSDLGRRAAGLLSVKAGDRGIRIDTPPMGEGIRAIGEYRRVLQILVNLVGNAVRYSPDGAKVWLRCDEEDGTASIVVADQGRGIAPADQERMFEKFERLGREDGAGSGLGLYISRRLARAMGGDIEVESALGQGARFTLRLPSAAGGEG